MKAHQTDMVDPKSRQLIWFLAVKLIAIIAFTSESLSQNREVKDEDCKLIPGGNATIERLARITGPISVNNLELTYFGKSLYNLTPEDFEYLKNLKPFCDGSDEKVAQLIFQRLKEKVEEARSTRQQTVLWMEERVKTLESMKTSPKAIQFLHNTWTEMQNRNQEMLKTDLKYFASYLTRKRQELYNTGPAGRGYQVNPFYPGPTIPNNSKEY